MDENNSEKLNVDEVRGGEQTEQPVISVPPELDVNNRPHSNKKLFIIIGVLLVILLAVSAYFFFKKDNKPVTNQTTANPKTEQKKTEEPKKEAEIEPALKKFITPTTGETWLATPKKVANLGYLKDYGTGADDGLAYYEVGARSGNIIYMASLQVLGEVNYLFEKNPSGGVRFISQPNSNFNYNEETAKQETDMLAPKVIFDKEIHYDSLSFPNKITLKNGYSLKLSAYDALGSHLSADNNKTKVTPVETYGGSKLDLVESQNLDTALTSISYRLTFPTQTATTLEYQPLNLDMSSYRFTVGYPTVSDKLVAITRGCGNLFSSVSRADSIKDSDLKEVGVSDTGQKLYEAVSADNILVKKAFDEFKEFYATDSDSYKKSLSKEEFIKNHSVIFFKDSEGQWLVYAREQYRPAYGCAKPVVYLYPEYAQNVSVKVGADVKISDPLYDPSNGWQNVWADSSGLLSYRGIDYHSLFWEGPGYGQYPVIDSGVVVPTSQAVATIKIQLAEQGFNGQEIADFVDYWTPNLPSQPYIRLSWLTTEQMNNLAPLNIAPKPYTLIRTFLDFTGLDQPMSLTPQKFTAPERNGFTVVEWGGLSTKKLY